MKKGSVREDWLSIFCVYADANYTKRELCSSKSIEMLKQTTPTVYYLQLCTSGSKLF